MRSLFGRVMVLAVALLGLQAPALQSQTSASRTGTGPATRTERQGASVQPVPLTRGEAASLRARERAAPNLASERGAGCRQVWDNSEQRTKIICVDPYRVGILLGISGAAVGGLAFDSAGLALFGGATGFLIGYGLFKLAGY